MENTNAVSRIGKEYREVRKIRVDQALVKAGLLETWIADMEAEAVAFFNDQLRILESGTSGDQEHLYNEISDRMAESLASLRAAKENARSTFIHVAHAMHFGALSNLINIEAIDNESDKF